MMNVQQNLSGTVRSQTEPTALCRIRGSFSTMAKQGSRLCAVARQLFAGVPLSPLESRSSHRTLAEKLLYSHAQ